MYEELHVVDGFFFVLVYVFPELFFFQPTVPPHHSWLAAMMMRDVMRDEITITIAGKRKGERKKWMREKNGECVRIRLIFII